MAEQPPTQKKKKKNSLLEKNKKEDPDQVEIEYLKKDIEEERNIQKNAQWNNEELERSVENMERTVMELEAGNYDADDSDLKHSYDNQRQLNLQLQEQKRWLEHELEQIKLKIQNDKLSPLPESFFLDWDNLSETELKRLVVQLEKTKNDVLSDLHDMEWRLDHEGKEYYHFDEFCQIYRAEILNLNRTLDALMRDGLLPPTYIITLPSHVFSSDFSSLGSSGAVTPGGVIAQLMSPKKTSSSPTRWPAVGSGSPTRKPGVGSVSPTRKPGLGSISPTRRPKNQTSPRRRIQKSDTNGKSMANGKADTRLDPKLGQPRKTAGVRKLPKIERKNAVSGPPSGSDEFGPPPLPSTIGPKKTSTAMNELDPVAESPTESTEDQP